MRFQTTTTSLEELIEGFDRIQGEADDSLASRGLFFAEDPPELPFGCERFISREEHGVPIIKDATELSSIEINKLATFYANMSNYTEGVALDYKCKHSDTEKVRKRLESSLKIYFHDEKKVKATLCMDYVRDDPQHQAIEKECSRWWRCIKKSELMMNRCRRMTRLLLSERVRRGEVMSMEAFENSSGEYNGDWKR